MDGVTAFASPRRMEGAKRGPTATPWPYQVITRLGTPPVGPDDLEAEVVILPAIEQPEPERLALLEESLIRLIETLQSYTHTIGVTLEQLEAIRKQLVPKRAHRRRPLS